VKSAPSIKKAAAHILAGSVVFLAAFLTHSIFASALPRPFASASIHSANAGSNSPVRIASPQSQNASPGTISGHVYRGDTGEPLPKASVILTPSQDRTQANSNSQVLRQVTRTNSDGSFSFANVSPGRYTARAEHVGYLAQQFGQGEGRGGAEIFTVSPGQSRDKIDFRLGPAGVISGNIRDEDNEPMEGVVISVVRLRYARNGARQEVTSQIVTTDDLGNYRLFGLLPGFYYVRVAGSARDTQAEGPTTGVAYRPTYYPGTGSIDDAQRVQVAPGVETPGISFTVGTQTTHTISGTVLDTSGPSDTRRFMVTASRGTISAGQIGMGFTTGQMSRVSSPDGTFAISGLPSGEYTLTARSMQVSQQGGSITSISAQNPAESDTGYATVRVADGDARVNIPVSRPSSIKGRVIVEGTRQPPSQGMRLTLQGVFGAAPGNNTQNPALDANGAFELRDIGSGQYTFNIAGGQNQLYLKQVACSGKDYSVQPITLESGIALNDCVLTLGTDAGTFSGQVTDSGKPVQGLVVIAIPESSDLRPLGRYTFTGKTDADGNYQIAGVIPGDYLLFAVTANDEQTYFAPDFAEKNIRDAERITIHANETKTVNPKPSPAQ
jgi:protocatechuate 3,4-dioxygenase beta subunit